MNDDAMDDDSSSHLQQVLDANQAELLAEFERRRRVSQKAYFFTLSFYNPV